MAQAGVALNYRVGCAQVRVAERLQDEEKMAHDAAMTAVGTEIARLKRGQLIWQSLSEIQVEFLPVPHRRKGIILPASCALWSSPQLFADSGQPKQMTCRLGPRKSD